MSTSPGAKTLSCVIDALVRVGQATAHDLAAHTGRKYKLVERALTWMRIEEFVRVIGRVRGGGRSYRSVYEATGKTFTPPVRQKKTPVMQKSLSVAAPVGRWVNPTKGSGVIAPAPYYTGMGLKGWGGWGKR